MTDTDDPDYESIKAEFLAAEGYLQELVSLTSVDVLGSSTRSFMDKVILSSAAGALISTFGYDPGASLGPIKITITSTWVVPVAALFAIGFYAMGLALLARVDYRRWKATYAMKSAAIISLGKKLIDLQTQLMRDVRAYGNRAIQDMASGKYLEEDVPMTDGMPTEFISRLKSMEKKFFNLDMLINQIGDPLGEMKKQAKRQILVFVVLPLAFCTFALFLCTWSLLKAIVHSGVMA